MLFPKPPKSDLAGGLVYITKKHLERCISINGAAGKNRTCDPVITNDVLYQLSYNGLIKSILTLKTHNNILYWSGIFNPAKVNI